MDPLYELGTHELVDIFRNSLKLHDLEPTPNHTSIRKQQITHQLQKQFSLDLLGLLHVLSELENRGLKNI